MSLNRDDNGPTQVHPPLTFNDLTSHMQQLNGIGIVNSKNSYGEFSLIRELSSWDRLKVP